MNIAFLCLAIPAYGQDTADNYLAKVAILDYGRVERESLVWKSFSEQLSELNTNLQKEAKEQQEKFAKKQDELRQKQTILSPESFAVEEKKFRDEVQEIQNQMNVKKRQLDQLYTKARQQIRLAIGGIVAELSEKNDFNIVLNTSQNDSTLFFWRKNIVISDAVLEILNQRLKSMEITKLDEKDNAAN